MTRVVIVGAHGKVAQQLMRVLYDNGDDFVGIVRNEEHADDVYRLGGEGVLLDIEKATPEQLSTAFAGSDAVVFAAGAGAGSGIERKRTVDYEGSVKSMQGAVLAGIRRFVQVSAWGVDAPLPDDTEPVWRAYVEAKRDADAVLRESGLDWTILRPGGLTTEEGTGLVTIGDSVERGSIPREDVARLISACIDEPGTIGHVWEAVSGSTPIDDAVRALVASA
ncbi:SDR family oxidoreductase [Leifsonia sp. NCR5]|uniref:SDR family oxidoreductase n=1 Tax=Leifsonia sp. NCR5 TaxID=1978342 RepID=UPI000A18BA98|nr:SDR family oxidoreductase [Leifsonia sp. NCR5]